MDLTAFVGQLPSVKIERLYEKPFTCLAVFRSLGRIEKEYVYRLMCSGESVEDAVPCAWTQCC